MRTRMTRITTTVAAMLLGAALVMPQQASARPMIWLPRTGGHPMGNFTTRPMGVQHPGRVAGGVMHPGENWGMHSGGYWRHGHYRGYGYGYFGAGLVAGALLAAPYYGYDYYPYGYGASGYGDADAYCVARFRTYDPATHTYIGYDGLLHHCP